MLLGQYSGKRTESVTMISRLTSAEQEALAILATTLHTFIARSRMTKSEIATLAEVSTPAIELITSRKAHELDRDVLYKVHRVVSRCLPSPHPEFFDHQIRVLKEGVTSEFVPIAPLQEAPQLSS